MSQGVYCKNCRVPVFVCHCSIHLQKTVFFSQTVQLPMLRCTVKLNRNIPFRMKMIPETLCKDFIAKKWARANDLLKKEKGNPQGRNSS
jgi:hypothetical protein